MRDDDAVYWSSVYFSAELLAVRAVEAELCIQRYINGGDGGRNYLATESECTELSNAFANVCETVGALESLIGTANGRPAELTAAAGEPDWLITLQQLICRLREWFPFERLYRTTQVYLRQAAEGPRADNLADYLKKQYVFELFLRESHEGPPDWTPVARSIADHLECLAAVRTILARRAQNTIAPGAYDTHSSRAGEEPTGIPKEHQSRPLSVAEAAALFYPTMRPQARQRVLRESAKDGLIHRIRRNRQSYIYDVRDFPRASQKEARP